MGRHHRPLTRREGYHGPDFVPSKFRGVGDIPAY